MLEAAVVGTGRCGTGYFARLLTSLGLPCSHEGVFGPTGPRENPLIKYDCSWMALPFLVPFARVVHLVRDPINVVGSLMGVGFFKGYRNDPYTCFARRYVLLEYDSAILNTLAFVIAWNRRIEEFTDNRYLVENEDPIELQVTLERIGVRLPLPLIAQVLQDTPRNINARSRENLTWSDLPEHTLSHQLLEMARRYGYVTQDAR